VEKSILIFSLCRVLIDKKKEKWDEKIERSLKWGVSEEESGSEKDHRWGHGGWWK